MPNTMPACKMRRMEPRAAIAAWRKKFGWNQSELARNLQPPVTPQTVQQWEKEGGTTPSGASLRALAALFGTTPAGVLAGPDAPATAASKAVGDDRMEISVSAFIALTSELTLLKQRVMELEGGAQGPPEAGDTTQELINATPGHTVERRVKDRRK